MTPLILFSIEVLVSEVVRKVTFGKVIEYCAELVGYRFEAQNEELALSVADEEAV